jgi:hypothetical protein
MSRPILRVVLSGLLVLGLGSTLGSCGSGGGGGGGATTETVTGTAAIGAPFVNGTITLISSNGTTRDVTTGANGSFSVDVTGLNGPYLLQAGSGAQTLSSWSPGGGVANITPLTTLALELVVVSNVLDLSIDWATKKTAITQAGINTMLAVINANLQNQFTAAGLTAQTYNLLTTPFVANGTGIDKVLDGVHITFDFATGSFNLEDPSDQPIAFDPNIDTTGFNGGGLGGSVNVTVSNTIPATANGAISATTISASNDPVPPPAPLSVLVSVDGTVGDQQIVLNVYYEKTTGPVTRVVFRWGPLTGTVVREASCDLFGPCTGATVDSTTGIITLTNVRLNTLVGLPTASATLNGAIRFTPPL